MTLKKDCCIISKIFKKGVRKIKKEKSTKEWLPFEKILDNGIVVTKDSYIKIVRVTPINYHLKSNLEKEAILNSYKLFLKTCDFNIQILVQSKKESLSKMFLDLNEKSQKESKKIKELADKYKEFIMLKNNENKASSKDFYIVLKKEKREFQKDEDKSINEKMIINMLNENFFKIKEALSRCGNIVYDINDKNESVFILSSFTTTINYMKGE